MQLNLLLQIGENQQEALELAPQPIQDVANSINYIHLLPWYDGVMIVGFLCLLIGIFDIKNVNIKSYVKPAYVAFFGLILLFVAVAGRVDSVRKLNRISELRHEFQVANGRKDYLQAYRALESLKKIEPDNSWVFKQTAIIQVEVLEDYFENKNSKPKYLKSDLKSEDLLKIANWSLDNADESLKVNSEDAETWELSSKIYYYIGRLNEKKNDSDKYIEKALNSIETALKLNQDLGNIDTVKAYVNKGLFLVILDRKDEAVIAYEKALEIINRKVDSGEYIDDDTKDLIPEIQNRIDRANNNKLD